VCVGEDVELIDLVVDEDYDWGTPGDRSTDDEPF
jgi:hypothetical protein